MKRCFALFFFAGLYSASPTPASACSPPSPYSQLYSANVASAIPAKVVPKGAVQLKVESPDYEQWRSDIFDVGKIDLRVKQVLNETFPDTVVLLNITNVDHCNSWFEPQVGDFFITVLPMSYADGKPVLDRSGRQEFASLFYKSEETYEFENKKIPQFAEYSPMTNFSFYDPQKLACLYKDSDNFADWSEDAWRRCVGPGEYVMLDCGRKQAGDLVCEQDDHGSIRPPELRRGYSFWDHYGPTISSILLILAILLGMAYFFLKKKLPRS